MSGLNPRQLLYAVVRPTLEHIQLWDDDAEALILGTGLTESGLASLDQGDPKIPGPAYGLYQMEEATHDDIWQNYLAYRKTLATAVKTLVASWPPGIAALAGNLYYATAMCRIRYLRVPEPLPRKSDLRAMAQFWKKWYNTDKGAGTPDDFVTRASIINDPSAWS